MNLKGKQKELAGKKSFNIFPKINLFSEFTSKIFANFNVIKKCY